MMRVNVRLWGLVCLLAGAIVQPPRVFGAALDKDGTIKLGVRTYASGRVGTEHTDVRFSPVIPRDPAVPNSRDVEAYKSLTYPLSDDGHLRQSRYFIEAELDHDLIPLIKKNFGPFGLLTDLPFEITQLRYHLTYRGEYEGVYDYGPSEYRNHGQYDDVYRDGGQDFELVSDFPGGAAFREQVASDARKRLRDVAGHRERLFQAFLDVAAGDVTLRIGRQILAWGETDAFRLLDNINPTDSSFGGFLISLDERRVPLDMLKANYFIGNLGPMSEFFVEGFLAIDDEVGFNPGIPTGSPWGLPNLGAPSTSLVTIRESPAHTFEDARGGGRATFNLPLPVVGSGTFTLAHYYTYFDTPAVQTFVCNSFPAGSCAYGAAEKEAGVPSQVNGYFAVAKQTAPRVQVTGASTTFAVPPNLAQYVGLGGEPIIRAELAYFKGEPRFSQRNLDPFLYKLFDNELTGGRRTGDSWNAVVGVDINQWIRFLNPNQSFFFSTQFFYKHLNGAVKRKRLGVYHGPSGDPRNGSICDVGSDSACEFYVTDGEVLPVPEFNQSISNEAALADPLQSVLVHNPVDQYLQTLLVATSYYSSQINPNLFMAYDWSGALVVGPGVTFSRDPFRFRVEYNYLFSSRYKGASGISLLRDRDNVLFQLEYVI